eukprot:COSAG02_NODE_2617_length_8409_cov_2.491697_2_plen_139_part_00
MEAPAPAAAAAAEPTATATEAAAGPAAADWLADCDLEDLKAYCRALSNKKTTPRKNETLKAKINEKCIKKLKDPIAGLLTAGFPGDNEETSRVNFRSGYNDGIPHVIVTSTPHLPKQFCRETIRGGQHSARCGDDPHG